MTADRINGPRPDTLLGIRLVTFLDTVGPLLPFEVARYFAIDEMVARDALTLLVRTGHVRFSKEQWLHYESTRLFNPDADRPASPGGHSGPPCPPDCTACTAPLPL